MAVDKPVSIEGYKENFLPRIHEMLEKHGEIRLLVHFRAYQGWEEAAAAMDFSVTQQLGPKVRKFAMVNPPEKLITQYAIKKPLIGGEVKVFGDDNLEEAKKWVQE